MGWKKNYVTNRLGFLFYEIQFWEAEKNICQKLKLKIKFIKILDWFKWECYNFDTTIEM